MVVLAGQLIVFWYVFHEFHITIAKQTPPNTLLLDQQNSTGMKSYAGYLRNPINFFSPGVLLIGKLFLSTDLDFSLEILKPPCDAHTSKENPLEHFNF